MSIYHLVTSSPLKFDFRVYIPSIIPSMKEKYFAEAIKEYEKRISAYAEVRDINLKEENLDNLRDGDIAAALEKEGKAILESIPPRAYKVALCVEGKEYDSPALAALLGSAIDSNGKITFIIGSSHGLSDTVKKECDARISFSKLTFPHQLMRVILTEALYRSFTILAGKKYHK